MSSEGVARTALVLGVVFAGVVLAIWSTWDAASILGFLGGLVGVGVALLVQLKATQSQLRATEEVHTMVNQQRSDAQAYQNVLTDTLRDAGMSVPADRSLDKPLDKPAG